jgi:lysophospholipase L1-like esterase
MNTNSPKNSRTRKLSGLRKFIFWLILACMPVLFFAILELLVRLVGLGMEYPLFIPVEKQVGYLQPNPDVIKRYFSRPELAPQVSPDTLYFLAEKPADSVRIVILGESTAAGFPYGRFGSPAGMLAQRLKPLYPEKNIEIISVAMAAINTYTLRDFSDEVVAIKPDVVLIYAGHNEYLGVMGVGSALAARDSRWKTLTYIALRHSHLFQLFDSAIAELGKINAPPKQVNERTLMATVAADKNIAINSPQYQQGLRQFEENMRDIIVKYRAARVPVVLGTLACNERDQKPFSSENRDAQQLQSMLQVAADFAAAGINTEAEKHLLAAINAYPNSADAHFALGKIYTDVNNKEAAQKQFLLAKDLDLLRFRAPEAINNIILNLANEQGVFLADSQQLLRSQSPKNTIGSELMLEHLHPNSDGYFWLTEAFFQALLNNKILPESSFNLTPDQAMQWKPVSPIDDIYAAWTIAKLTADFPFTQTSKVFEMGDLNTPEKQLAAARYLGKSSWLDTTQKAFEYYQEQKNGHAAFIVIGQLSDALPMNDSLTKTAAKIAMDLQLTQLVLFYTERGLRINSSDQELLMLKAHALFIVKRFVDSKRILQQVIKLNPQHPMASEFLKESWATSLQ